MGLAFSPANSSDSFAVFAMATTVEYVTEMYHSPWAYSKLPDPEASNKRTTRENLEAAGVADGLGHQLKLEERKAVTEDRFRSSDIDLVDLHKRIARLEEKHRSRYEGYERKRYAVQLAYTLDKTLVDKLLEESGCPSADELGITWISQVQKAILRKRNYDDILDEQQRKVVEQRWNELKEELGWSEKHYRWVKWLKKQGTPSAFDPEFDVADAVTELSILDPEIASICEELIKVYKNLHA